MKGFSLDLRHCALLSRRFIGNLQILLFVRSTVTSISPINSLFQGWNWNTEQNRRPNAPGPSPVAIHQKSLFSLRLSLSCSELANSEILRVLYGGSQAKQTTTFVISSVNGSPTSTMSLNGAAFVLQTDLTSVSGLPYGFIAVQLSFISRLEDGDPSLVMSYAFREAIRFGALRRSDSVQA